MTTLSQRYDELYRLHLAARWGDASAAFARITGLRLPPLAEAPAVDLTLPRAALIRYDLPRPVDLCALRTGARDVAKFEDLSLATLTALARTLENQSFQVVTAGPYARRMDVTLSTDGADRHLYTLVASRGDAARRLVEAERERSPEATRAAGRALGYPPCCVDHFVDFERSAEAEREGVNEASLRAFLDTGPLPWELNPLSTHALIGFIPCRTGCPLALAFARRILAAVERRDPRGADTVHTTLQRPILFVRHTVFFAFAGAASVSAGSLRYGRAVAHDDGASPLLSAWRDATLGRALRPDGHLALADTLELPDATWELSSPPVPRLITPQT